MSAGGYERFLEMSAEDLEVLRERARTLAVVVDSAPAGDLLDVLEIQSRGQRFALPLEVVDGIVELVSIATVPRSPPFLRGLIGFRGEILVGVELSSFVGATESGFADLKRVIALSTKAGKLAILAERTISVQAVSPKNFGTNPVGQQSFVTGTDERLVSLLDPALLIAAVFQSLTGVTV